jgi:hypothetical protein
MSLHGPSEVGAAPLTAVASEKIFLKRTKLTLRASNELVASGQRSFAPFLLHDAFESDLRCSTVGSCRDSG